PQQVKSWKCWSLPDAARRRRAPLSPRTLVARSPAGPARSFRARPVPRSSRVMPKIRIAQCPNLLLITLVVVLAADGRARGGSIVNGGFETGDFTGWSTLGNASVVDASFQTGPALGQYQALVSSAIGSVDVGSLEGALNLGPGSLSG